MEHNVLIGNGWPMTLVRRNVRITVISVEVLRQYLQKADRIYSFWGHKNTLRVANAILGVDVTPKSERPAIELTYHGFPTLEGEVFYRVFILTPEYRPGFRPKIGEEVAEADIVGWSALRITYE